MSGIDLTAAPTSPGPTDAATQDRRLLRWGGVAGLGGVFLLLASVVVVLSFGLPDAADLETLTDFDDLEVGRIAEHFLYLGALVLFALHVVVLRRALHAADPAAALFGAVVALFGFVILAASSVLHVSTAALSDLYEDPSRSADGRESIEYAWAGAQSVFDTMLVTGLLLVPVGLALLGVAMRHAPGFGPRLATSCLVLGGLGFVGAAIETVDTSTDLSALSVLAMVAFSLIVGWRLLRLGSEAAARDAAAAQ
ncbi:MAG: DUF4386 family protein [Actinomycetota bacterium]